MATATLTISLILQTFQPFGLFPNSYLTDLDGTCLGCLVYEGPDKPRIS